MQRRLPPKAPSVGSGSSDPTTPSPNATPSEPAVPAVPAVPQTVDELLAAHSGSFGEGPSDSDQRKMMKSIATDPSKITSALKQMNVDGDMVSKIISDVKNNPNAMKEIQKMTTESGLQHQLQSSLSRGQSRGRGDERPTRKKILELQKQMKNALKETRANDADVVKTKVLWLTASRKYKCVDLPDDKILDHAAIKLRFRSDYEVIQNGEIAFVCSTTSQNMSNKVLEKLVGKGHGVEAILVHGVYDSETKSISSLGNLTDKDVGKIRSLIAKN